jgi:hypothetical protein
MPQETRSLWEIYDSEVEPWRRGRMALVLIAVLNVVLEALDIASHLILGDIQRVLTVSALFILFWFQFYFIWIGVHWIRWLAAAWTGLTGFCFIIWAVGDNNAVLGFFGAINLVVAAYLSLSPSVYFFAKRQRKTVRWKEALGVAAVCFLVLCSIGAAMIGVWGFRIRQTREAAEFADIAAQHVYVDLDSDWTVLHVTQSSLQDDGSARLKFFFDDMKERLRSVHQISEPGGIVRVQFQFPTGFRWHAHVTLHAESKDGPARLHFILSKSAQDWEIEHMWWEYLPLP